MSVCYSIIKAVCSACGIGYTEFGLIDNTYFPEYPKSTTYQRRLLPLVMMKSRERQRINP